MKKKLLIPTDSFLPRWDGIARFLKEILPVLCKEYDVTVIAPDFGDLKVKGFTLIRFPVTQMTIAGYTPVKFSRDMVSSVKKLVKEADIVWGQTIGPVGAASMFYAKKYKKPLLAFIHSIEWDLFSKSIKRFQRTIRFTSKRFVPFLYNKCDVLLVPSEETAELLNKRGIIAPKEVVHLGINTEKFEPPKDKRRAKRKVGLDPDKIVIGYLGRIGREKNLKTLYDAFRGLHRDDTTLLIVGGELSKTEFFNRHDIINVGPVENVLDYYRAMDLYVLPSLTETTSLTTMEAMACELPVVCTPVGRIKEYVHHRQNGYLFPKGNVSRLKLILKTLLDNEHVRRRVGKKARQTIVKEHSWTKTAKQICSILDEY